MDVSEATPGDATASADTLILVPLTDTVLLPGMVMPLTIGRPTAAAALQEAARTERHVAVVLQHEPFSEVPGLDELHSIGTEARLLRYFTARDGSHNAIVQGVGRVRPREVLTDTPHPAVKVL